MNQKPKNWRSNSAFLHYIEQIDSGIFIAMSARTFFLVVGIVLSVVSLNWLGYWSIALGAVVVIWYIAALTRHNKKIDQYWNEFKK